MIVFLSVCSQSTLICFGKSILSMAFYRSLYIYPTISPNPKAGSYQRKNASLSLYRLGGPVLVAGLGFIRWRLSSWCMGYNIVIYWNHERIEGCYWNMRWSERNQFGTHVRFHRRCRQRLGVTPNQSRHTSVGLIRETWGYRYYAEYNFG